MQPIYFYLDLFTISGPFILSFDRKVAFYKSWKYLFPAILAMGAFFIAKDAIFAARGIWGFNDRYLLGPRLLGLPLEEWLFFVVVPYALVFIDACLRAYFPGDPLQRIHRPFLALLSLVLLITGLIFAQRLYTSVVFVLTACLLCYHLYRRTPWLSLFLRAWLVSFIPFFLVNGILTGSFLDEPIVWYNDAHNLGIRMITIPIEDSMYNLLMFLMTTQIMEWLKKRY